jgi:hypothetical protein
MSDWIDDAVPTTESWVFLTIDELKDALRAAHAEHCEHKAELASLRALPLLDEEMAQRIADETRRCYLVQPLAGGDPIKEVLPLTILRVADEAGKEKTCRARE